MKYTLEGFSQEAALNMRTTVTDNGRTKTIKLDLIDLTILRWIVDFYPSMKKTIIEGVEYAWLDYKSFVEDMPLLGLSNQSLYKRCMKMVQLGVLTHKTLRSGGTFSYYGFGPEYQRLVNGRHTATQAPAATKGTRADTTNVDTTQSQSPDDEPQPLIAEPQTTKQQDKPDAIKEIVDHLNARLGTHYKPTTQATRKLLKARLNEGFTVEEIKTVIDKKAAEWLGNASMAQYLRPETLFGNKFESYLNARTATRTNTYSNAHPYSDASANAYAHANGYSKYTPIDDEGHLAECTRENGWF